MIEVENLTKVYGDTRAVDQLSFSVRPGSVTGFLGPNGAGKSTTMRMILGLDNPTSGTARINGVPYNKLDRPLTQVGALLDANWVHPNRSAKAHLTWMAVSNKISRSRVTEVLKVVGLADVADKSAGKFSLGMKQRLGLAGALLGDPGVLLFDEPVNGLDPEGILWIRQFMQKLASDGRCVLVSSHLLSEMALTADHLVVIGRGKLITDESTDAFINRTTSTTVRVRAPRLSELAPLLSSQGATIAAIAPSPGELVATSPAATVSGLPIEQIGEIAGAAGLVLHELAPIRGSLEEAFMQITGDSVQFGGQAAPAPNAPIDSTGGR